MTIKILNFIFVITIIIGMIGLASAVDPDVWYKFENNGVDSGTSGSTLTLNGASSFNSTSFKQGSYSRTHPTDSTNEQDYSSYSGNFGTNPFTIVYWINTTDAQGESNVIGTEPNQWGGVSDGKWTIALTHISGEARWIKTASGTYGLVAESNTAVNDGEWHRVVFVREGTGANKFKIYVDGLNEANATDATNYNGGSTLYLFSIPLLITYTSGLKGSLDDIKIYNNTAWSDAEVKLDFGISSGLLTPSLEYPTSNSLISTESYYFNASYVSSGYNLTNATYYVWKNGVLNNRTSSTISGVSNRTTKLISGLTLGSYEWNVRVCGTNYTGYLCNFASSNFTFSVGATLNSSTYNVNVYETSRQNFLATFNLINGSQISLAQLVYNGTNYTISNSSISGNILTLSKDINIPLNRYLFLNETKNFYFRFTYSGNFIQETEVFTQNVSFINLQYCNSSYSLTSINFTLLDEQTGLTINALNNPTTFQSTFRYWLGDGSVYKNYSYEFLNSTNLSNFAFCIYPYLPNNYTFKADLDSLFFAQGYSENQYYLRNATLTNIPTDFDLFLYLLDTTGATKFYINVKQGITFVSDALVTISKFFVAEGIYKTVSIKLSDNDGKLPFYADIDGKYRFSIVKDGQVLGIVEKVASCASAPCSLDINLQESIDSIFSSYDDAYAANVVSDLSYNQDTKIVTYSFLDLTGMAQYFRLKVTKPHLNGTISTTICDVTSYSSSGTLTCNLSSYNGDFFAYGYVARSPEKYDKFISFFTNKDITELGFMGLLISFVIMLTVILASATISRGNPSTVIFMLGATLILLKASNLFPFSWALVITLEVVFGFVLIKTKS